MRPRPSPWGPTVGEAQPSPAGRRLSRAEPHKLVGRPPPTLAERWDDLRWVILFRLQPVALLLGDVLGLFLSVPIYFLARASTRAASRLAPAVLRAHGVDRGLWEAVRIYVGAAPCDEIAEHRARQVENSVLEALRDRDVERQRRRGLVRSPEERSS